MIFFVITIIHHAIKKYFANDKKTNMIFENLTMKNILRVIFVEKYDDKKLKIKHECE